MKGDQVLDDNLVWGDHVCIREETPRKYKIMRYGIVCGARTIKDIDMSEKFGQPMGTTLYLVESSDGESIDIPGQYLMKH